ncbi:MAG: insulinase family protein [Deltaproteobacteria bacterium]|nr:insulinase family protein [Deltaproteobacteria bacterium]
MVWWLSRWMVLAAVGLGLVGCPSPPPSTPRERATPLVPPRPELGSSPDVVFPVAERFALANGLEVQVLRVGRLPMAHFVLVVRGGQASEPPGLPGLADFTGELLKEGTKHRTAEEVLAAVEDLGGTFRISTDRDAVYHVLSVPSEHAATALETLAEVVTEPAFPEEEVERHRGRELGRLALLRADPNYVAQVVLFRELYGDHPYARVDATPESLALIQREHLVTFHRDRYAADGAFLIVAGDVDAAALRPLVDEAFGTWRTGAATPMPVPDPPAIPARRVLLVDRPGSSQTTIQVGFVTVPQRDPDFPALTVAADVLGGSASARLFLNLRERHGWTYGAYSSLEETADRAPATVFSDVEAEASGEALVEVMGELRRLRTTEPGREELAARQGYLTRILPLRVETPLNLAYMLAQLELNGLPADYWDTYAERINAVTPEQVRQAADRFLDDGRAVVVVVGVADELFEACRAIGPVTRTDIDGARDTTPMPPAQEATRRPAPTPCGERAADRFSPRRSARGG